jgi:hypothetical protein
MAVPEHLYFVGSTLRKWGSLRGAGVAHVSAGSGMIGAGFLSRVV